MAVTGSAQIKIYDRDGIERGESLRGDMYIRDQRNTKGHVSPATGGHWNPTDRYVETSALKLHLPSLAGGSNPNATVVLYMCCCESFSVKDCIVGHS